MDCHIKSAVILHLYYQDMWDEISAYLNNLDGHAYDLFVTMVRENREMYDKIKAFKPELEIIPVPNTGYDIYPFLYVLNHINIYDYDYIFKVHTKRDLGLIHLRVNRLIFQNEEWKRYLFKAILGSKQIIRKNLKHFRQDKTLGMIASKSLTTSIQADDIRNRTVSELAHLGFDFHPDMRFVAGTVFMIRANILIPLISRKYTETDFEKSDGTIHDGGFSHVMERVLGSIVHAQGYTIRGYDKYGGLRICIKKFFYKKKLLKNGKICIKIAGIPVFIQSERGHRMH